MDKFEFFKRFCNRTHSWMVKAFCENIKEILKNTRMFEDFFPKTDILLVKMLFLISYFPEFSATSC